MESRKSESRFVSRVLLAFTSSPLPNFVLSWQSLPMIYVTISNVACLLGYQSPYILIQFGWLTSWFYLRFIKFNEGGDFRGDRSETFSFSAWFPPFLQYVSISFAPSLAKTDSISLAGNTSLEAQRSCLISRSRCASFVLGPISNPAVPTPT